MTAPIARMTSDLLREMRAEATDAAALDDWIALAVKHGLGRTMNPIGMQTGAVFVTDQGYRTGELEEFCAALLRTQAARIAELEAALAAADAASQPELTMSMFASAADLEAARAALAQPPAAPAVAGEVAMPEPLRAALLAYFQAADAAWIEICEEAKKRGISSMPILPGQAKSLEQYNELRRVFDADARASQALARVPLSDEVRHLLWGEHPECCGCPVVGAQYMGASEMVCCGNPEPALLNDAQIVASLRAMFPAPTEGGAA